MNLAYLSRRNRTINVVAVGVVLLFLAGVVFLLSGVWATFVNRPSGEEVLFVVEPGDTLSGAKQRLVDAGLLKAPFWFSVYGKLHPRRVMQAGAVPLSLDMSIQKLYDALSDAESLEREFTFIEGWTIEQLGKHLESRGIVSQTDLRLALSNPRLKEKYPFLSLVPDGTYEGYLFPDTYRIRNTATADDIVARLLDEFDERVAVQYAQQIAASGYSLHEIVTIASLLEREVTSNEDRAYVSGIIRNRLELGMALQLDATVNYATGKNDAQATLQDIQVDSLYNTYKYPGLPVGPIANPGEAAIEAALNPIDNPYYFYLTTQDGEVIYARTHDEHVRNKARYL